MILGALIPPQAALALSAALASTPSVPLTPGTRETFAIQPHEGRRHSFVLEAGQFLQATVHQKGLDVVLRLLAPDGSVIEDAVDVARGVARLDLLALGQPAREAVDRLVRAVLGREDALPGEEPDEPAAHRLVVDRGLRGIAREEGQDRRQALSGERARHRHSPWSWNPAQ